MGNSSLAGLLGQDRLPARYLLLAAAFFILTLMVWYPIFISEVGWRWGGFVEISSIQARVISGLITAAIIRGLYELKIWLFLRIVAGDRESYSALKEAIIWGIGFCVGYWVIPALIWIANFGLSLLHNGFIVAVLVSAPAVVSIAAMQLLWFLYPECGKNPREKDA